MTKGKPMGAAGADERKPSDRRRFIKRGALASAGALGAASLRQQAYAADATASLPPNVPEWTRQQGAGFLNPPYGMPSPFDKSVVRKLPDSPAAFPTATRTPLQNLFGTITPNGLFFERHHAGVPAINPDAHRLMLHGMVERPLLLSMNDLLRYPSVSRVHYLECSGNSSAENHCSRCKCRIATASPSMTRGPMSGGCAACRTASSPSRPIVRRACRPLITRKCGTAAVAGGDIAPCVRLDFCPKRTTEHAENLGPHQFGECAKGDVDGGRTGP